MPMQPTSREDHARSRLAVMVLLIAFVLNFSGRGIADALAAFILPLEAEFGWKRSALTGIFAAYMLVSGLAAPLAGWSFDRFGPRVVYTAGLLCLGLAAMVAATAQSLWQVYLGAGVMMGVGAAATGMVCSTALVARWYRARLTTAIAIAYAGAGTGALIILPIAQTLIDSLGWRDAWLIMGVMPLVAAPLCAAMPWRRLAHPAAPQASHQRAAARSTVPDDESSRRPDSTGRLQALRAAWSDPCYWQLAQVFFFTALASYQVTPQVVAMLIEGGMKPIAAASAFGLAGLLSTVGIVAAGWLGDRIGHQRTAFLSFASTTLGMAGLLGVALAGSSVGLAMFVLCFGLAQGARGPIVSSLSNRIYAGPAAATIYGTLYGMMAIGAGLGAWMGGALHDLTNAYWPLVIVSIALVGLAALPFRRNSALMARLHILLR